MFGIGPQELILIFLIVLLLFGASRIPEIGRAMGKGIRDFKRATQDLEDEFNIDPPQEIPGKPKSTTTTSSNASATPEQKSS